MRHSSLPVALSRATTSADVPTGAISTRSFSISGHWPLYQGGIFEPYSWTRFLRQTSLPVAASRACRTALGSSEKTYFPSVAGTVRVMPWLGRMRRFSLKRQSSFPSSRRQAADEVLGGRLVVVVEVDLAAVDGGGGVALAHRRRPEDLRAALRPGAQETGLGGDAVAVGAAELRPVRGEAGCREGESPWRRTRDRHAARAGEGPSPEPRSGGSPIEDCSPSRPPRSTVARSPGGPPLRTLARRESLRNGSDDPSPSSVARDPRALRRRPSRVGAQSTRR